MAVTFDAIGTAPDVQPVATGFTYNSMTVGAGANRALLALLCLQPSGSDPAGTTLAWDTGVTIQNMTLLDSFSFATTGTIMQMWGLLNPNSGNLPLTAAWTNSALYAIDAISFAGVDQSNILTSFTNFGHATGTGTIASQSQACTATQYAVMQGTDTNSFNNTGNGSPIYRNASSKTGAIYDNTSPNTNMQLLTLLSGSWAVQGVTVVDVGGVVSMPFSQTDWPVYQWAWNRG